MNYKQIQQDYSKAFDALKKYSIKMWSASKFQITENIFSFFSGNSSEFEIIELRELYDFFDTNEIFILLTMYYNSEFSFDIVKDNVRIFESQIKYKTRTKAEEQGFLKCFEILESNL